MERTRRTNCDIWHLPSDSSIAGTLSGTSSNSAACYTHLNYLIQLKVDMIREIDVLYILILFASLEFHAYVATMFMQALDYSFPAAPGASY